MEKLMIVDDDKMTLQTLSAYLGGLYSIVCFLSGDEAVAAATREIFSVVLLDLRLDGMPGIEVLRQLKELCTYQQVIIITGHLSSQSAIAALNLGAFHYITKPYSFIELKQVVAHACQRYHEELLRETSLTRQRFELLGLSKREGDVVGGILQKKTNHEIAENLGISRRTVEKHVERIFSHFGISSRFALTQKIQEKLQKFLRISHREGGSG